MYVDTHTDIVFHFYNAFVSKMKKIDILSMLS